MCVCVKERERERHAGYCAGGRTGFDIRLIFGGGAEEEEGAAAKAEKKRNKKIERTTNQEKKRWGERARENENKRGREGDPVGVWTDG